MSDVKVGDFVNVTIKGVRQVSHPSARLVRIADEHGDVFDMPPQAAIELVAPATWPPRPGDLWRDKDARLWFAVESLRSEVSDEPVLLTCNGKNRRPAVDILDLYSPLTRVHREEATSCSCDHHGDHAGCGADCVCAP